MARPPRVYVAALEEMRNASGPITTDWVMARTGLDKRRAQNAIIIARAKHVIRVVCRGLYYPNAGAA